jgi:hypothetical protein
MDKTCAVSASIRYLDVICVIPLTSALGYWLVDMRISTLNVDRAAFGSVYRRANLDVMCSIANILGCVDCSGRLVDDRVKRRADLAVGANGRVRVRVRAWRETVAAAYYTDLATGYLPLGQR